MASRTASTRDAKQPIFTALVLAGARPGGDPFAHAMGVPYKALIPAGGEPMLLRVVRALRGSPHVGRIVAVGLPASALDAAPPLRELREGGTLELSEGDATPSRSVLAAIDASGARFPFLVTTADHPLLSAAIVSDFCAESLRSGADLTFALTAAEPVQRTFPGARRTTHRFRDGAYCGCNLFALLTPAARRGPQEWVRVEQYRKQPWRMVLALGPLTLLRFLLGTLALSDALDIATRRAGARARAVLLAQPEAGFDVDSPAQLRAVEDYLIRRRAGNPAPDPRQDPARCGPG